MIICTLKHSAHHNIIIHHIYKLYPLLQSSTECKYQQHCARLKKLTIVNKVEYGLPTRKDFMDYRLPEYAEIEIRKGMVDYD